jgi:hypothetical protein
VKEGGREREKREIRETEGKKLGREGEKIEGGGREGGRLGEEGGRRGAALIREINKEHRRIFYLRIKMKNN